MFVVSAAKVSQIFQICKTLAKKILILFFLCLRITPYAVKINLELSEILRYFAPTKPIDHETFFHT